MFAITPLREKRLRAVLTLADVAAKAGMSLTRASIIERDATRAKGGELDRLSAAIDEIQERQA
ncbi:MAG: helix-turn-helix transcriptional regulator [Thermoanaerobaculia bacterium]